MWHLFYDLAILGKSFTTSAHTHTHTQVKIGTVVENSSKNGMYLKSIVKIIR